MKLTPQDIHHKEFKRGMRGYNEEEVDLFLDQLAEQFEALYKQNHNYDEETATLNEKLQTYKNMELTLQNTLLTAQKSAEEVQMSAKNEADEVISNAKREAKRVLSKAEKQKQTLNETFAKLRSLETSFQSKIKENLESLLGKLDKIVEDESTLIEQIEKEFSKAPELDIPVVENAPKVHEPAKIEEISVVTDVTAEDAEEDPLLRADASKSDIASEEDIDKFLQQEKLPAPSEDTTSENKSGILGRIFKKKEAMDENGNGAQATHAQDEIEEIQEVDVQNIETEDKKKKTKVKNTKKQNTEEIKI